MVVDEGKTDTIEEIESEKPTPKAQPELTYAGWLS